MFHQNPFSAVIWFIYRSKILFSNPQNLYFPGRSMKHYKYSFAVMTIAFLVVVQCNGGDLQKLFLLDQPFGTSKVQTISLVS